jgi:hypothetical protein
MIYIVNIWPINLCINNTYKYANPQMIYSLGYGGSNYQLFFSNNYQLLVCICSLVFWITQCIGYIRSPCDLSQVLFCTQLPLCAVMLCRVLPIYCWFMRFSILIPYRSSLLFFHMCSLCFHVARPWCRLAWKCMLQLGTYNDTDRQRSTRTYFVSCEHGT